MLSGSENIGFLRDNFESVGAFLATAWHMQRCSFGIREERIQFRSTPQLGLPVAEVEHGSSHSLCEEDKENGIGKTLARVAHSLEGEGRGGEGRGGEGRGGEGRGGEGRGGEGSNYRAHQCSLH